MCVFIKKKPPKNLVHLKSSLIKGAHFGGTGLIEGVASLEEDNLVVIYSHRTPEIWPDKEGWSLMGVALEEGNCIPYRMMNVKKKLAIFLLFINFFFICLSNDPC